MDSYITLPYQRADHCRTTVGSHGCIIKRDIAEVLVRIHALPAISDEFISCGCIYHQIFMKMCEQTLEKY